MKVFNFCLLFYLNFSCAYNVIPDFLKTDGEAIYSLVKEQISFGPRVSGSKEIYKNFLWLKQWGKKYSYKVFSDKWDNFISGSRREMRNLYAIREGKRKTQNFIIIASHYDTKFIESKPNFLGVNDGGSSTALLAYIMKKIALFPNKWDKACQLRFVFFDGEECYYNYSSGDGLSGSYYLLNKLLNKDELQYCKAFILADMVGDKDLLIDFPKNTSLSLRRRSLNIAKLYNLEKFFQSSQRPIIDDHLPFFEKNVESINFIDFDYGKNNSFWHTKEDTIDKLSPSSLEKVGDVILKLIYDLSHLY